MKRIISMILVAVMLILSLVSCGYSIANEDISLYATLSSEDKAKLEKALKELKIEDGDFTTDPETRAKKIDDAIYAALAGTVSSDDKVTKGVPGARDLVYYGYYCTAKFGDETVTLYVTNMKTPVSVQMGLKDPTPLQEKLIALFEGVDFEGKTAEVVTSSSSTAKKGDLAFVTYTYTYTPKNENGTDGTPVATTVTNAPIIIGDKVADGETASNIEQQLNGQKINTTIANFELKDDKLGTVKYTGVKINWVTSGDALGSFTNVTFDEKTTVTDTKGVSRNLKDVELTYYVYPMGYAEVPEFNSNSVMNDILGSSITANIFYELVFGRDFVGNGDEDKKYTDEQKDAILDTYKNIVYKAIVEKVDENKNKTYETTDKTAETLASLISSIATSQTAYASAESTLEKAKDALEEAESTFESKTVALSSAQKAYDEKVAASGEESAATEKTALDKAKGEYDTAKIKLEGEADANGVVKGGAKNALKEAEEAFERASNNREYLLTALYGLDAGAMEAKIVDGYKTSTELYLADVYDNEIKLNVAKEVYYFIRQYVKVTEYPEKAVEETFDQLIQNYKYKFYNEDYATDDSNYKHYEKSFEKYLIATVKTDLKVTVETYEAALDALRENAKTYVEPILKIYAAAKAYGVTLTETEYDEYKEELGASYTNYVETYGENSFRYACQFDKLINELIKDGETAPGEDGSVNYNTLITYTIGTPASAVEDVEDEEEDEHAGHDHN